MSEENTTENRGFAALKEHVMNNRLDTALWASRILTIVFAIGYVIPIFGYVEFFTFPTNASVTVLSFYDIQKLTDSLQQSIDG